MVLRQGQSTNLGFYKSIQNRHLAKICELFVQLGDKFQGTDKFGTFCTFWYILKQQKLKNLVEIAHLCIVRVPTAADQQNCMIFPGIFFCLFCGFCVPFFQNK